MRTRLFLRTSEFLWQEGHNAFENAEQARADALKMIHVYNDLFEKEYALPGFVGEKTADERFPGAIQSFTIEAMMQDGKALQACTSHYLGQNFAKSCGIKFQSRDGKEELAHTTSWGLSTRSIGGLIMMHGDDDGLVMPPRLAPVQIIIIPITKDEAGSAALIESARALEKRLSSLGLRVQVDLTHDRAPDKMWRAIKRGIPLRVEMGQRELEQGVVTVTRRDVGRDSKTTLSQDEFCAQVEALLQTIHQEMFARAQKLVNSRIHDVQSVAALEEFYKSGGVGFVRADVQLLNDPNYEQIRKDHSLSSRCLPLEDEGRKVLIGKSY
jgi:prolyl-tRNA synthetase